MDKILNRICCIDNHPVSKLDKGFRMIYVQGLGACLYATSGNSPITKMLYLPWAESIIGNTDNLANYWTENTSVIKSAISLRRKGFSLFSMKYSFFYDVFYLLEQSFLPGYKIVNSYKYLKENICGIMTKGALEKVYLYWTANGPKPKAIDNVVVTHKQNNESIFSKREKRILVVANVSAGKSTLINSLIGCRMNRTKTTACTDRLVSIHNKCLKDGLTHKDLNGSYSYFKNLQEVNRDEIHEIAFTFNSSLNKEQICFIDTPGINNSEDSNHRRITENAITSGDYDAIMYVSNSQYVGTNDEHNLLKLLKSKVKKPILFVLNQLDNFIPEEDSIAKMMNDYKSDLLRIGFNNPIIVPVSACAACLFRFGADELTNTEKRKFKTLNEIFDNEYYDFPKYIEEGKSKNKLSMTGIISLENKLITI